MSLRPDSSVKIFPIGLGFITTSMKNAGYKFDLLDIDMKRYSDDEIDEIMSNNRYDIVCLGCLVTGYDKVKKICKTIRKYNEKATIIVGNSVATSIPEILLHKTDADIAVMGEGDETIIELIECIKNNGSFKDVEGIVFKDNDSVVYTPKRKIISNISNLPSIDFEIFDVESYIKNTSIPQLENIHPDNIRALPINTARGCVAKCTFCYHVFRGIKYRYRSAKSIVEEIKLLIDKYGINYVQFWDELTFFSKERALVLAEEIIKSGIKIYWAAQCRANLFTAESDLHIIKKLKEAGCYRIAYSLESSDSDILKAMNKKISVEDFVTQTRLMQSVGISTRTSLVFGYPQETPETINATINCCIENKMYPSVGFLLPQPGSAMYDYAIEKGIITDGEKYILGMGDRQDLFINLTSMSDKEFKDTVYNALKRCNKELNTKLSEDDLIKTKNKAI